MRTVTEVVGVEPHGPSEVGVLLSGGIDSAVLTGMLLGRNNSVTPFYVRTGCVWEDSELDAVRRFLAAIARPHLGGLTILDMPVTDLYRGHWSLSGESVPRQGTPDDAVYLPGRNPLLLLKPALWCLMHGVSQLAIATLANNPFDDAKPEFFSRYEAMLWAATGGTITIQRPFSELSKDQVVQLGSSLPLGLTFSCLAPRSGLHCGRCNKCAERRAALAQLAEGDPTRYAQD